MSICIIRPKSFIGPERLGVFAILYEWAKEGHNFPILGDGNNRYQLLDVDDLCDAIYQVSTALDAQCVNNVFNIGAGSYTTLKEDFQVVLNEAGHRKRIICFPALPVIWLLWVLELLHLSPLYKWVYETVSKDSYISIEKAQLAFGFKPKYSNQQALVRNYRWYISNYEHFQNKSGVSHRVPWKQGINA